VGISRAVEDEQGQPEGMGCTISVFSKTYDVVDQSRQLEERLPNRAISTRQLPIHRFVEDCVGSISGVRAGEHHISNLANIRDKATHQFTRVESSKTSSFSFPESPVQPEDHDLHRQFDSGGTDQQTGRNPELDFSSGDPSDPELGHKSQNGRYTPGW